MLNRFFYLFIVSLLSSAVIAQDDMDTEEKPPFDVSYGVKWNPASLYFGKVSIGGELNFKKKKSFTTVVGIPNDRTFTYEFDDKDQSLTLKTFSLMGGYRMYMGKKTMTGFYFEPYLKYNKTDGFVPDIRTTIGGQPTTFNLNAGYEGFGLGAQLGLQFAIANRVVFDMFILGPEANRAKFSLTLQDVTNPPSGAWDQVKEDDARRELEEIVSDIPILGDKIEISVNRSTKTVYSSYKGFVPGFRGGMSIGFRF